MLHHVTIVCLLGAAAAAPSYIGQDIAVGSVSNPSYGFNYAVSDPLTGDNKAQEERREGGVVKGSYSLSEPDGTIRVVNYNADPVTGFNAVVKRIGPAGHPQQYIPAPVVQAPIVQAPITKVIEPATSLVGLGYGGLGLGLKGGYGLNALDLGLKGGYGLGGLELGLKGGYGLNALDIGLKGGLGLGGLDLGLKGGLELGGLGLGLKGGLELGGYGGYGLDAGWKH